MSSTKSEDPSKSSKSAPRLKVNRGLLAYMPIGVALALILLHIANSPSWRICIIIACFMPYVIVIAARILVSVRQIKRNRELRIGKSRLRIDDSKEQ